MSDDNKKSGNEVIKDVVRIAEVELDGKRPFVVELRKIRGVGWRFAHAVAVVLGINKWVPIGSLSDEQLEKLEDILRNPLKYGIPEWLLNRRKDPYSGEDKHLVSNDWDLQMQLDKKREIELNTYKGERYKYGLPVRGQHTRSHHRKGGKPAQALKSSQESK